MVHDGSKRQILVALGRFPNSTLKEEPYPPEILLIKQILNTLKQLLKIIERYQLHTKALERECELPSVLLVSSRLPTVMIIFLLDLWLLSVCLLQNKTEQLHRCLKMDLLKCNFDK